MLIGGIVVFGRGAWTVRQADESYRLAERCCQAGDFEKAQLACEKALQLRPRHAPTLALRMEIESTLGWEWSSRPGFTAICRFPGAGSNTHPQALEEIDSAFARADRAFADREFGAAEREILKILEYAKWRPVSAELLTKQGRARELLERVRR